MISTLYLYVTSVHREPDEVLLLACAYLFGLALRCVVYVYGVHFSSVATERTPDNFKGYLRLMRVVGGYNVVSSALVHKLLSYHVSAYSQRHGQLSSEVTDTVLGYQGTLLAQVAAFGVFYLAMGCLQRCEESGPRKVAF